MMVNLSINNKRNGKAQAGYKAADFVFPGMRIGLGTGSTASYFIERLGALCRQGLQIQAFASSERSAIQAHDAGIPLGDINDVTSLDLTVDGADEIDENKRMIKGGGGALLREKILASMSQDVVIVVDESKCVKTLGAFPLPVELVPFAYQRTLFKLNSLGYVGNLRRTQDKPYVTDNGNYIYDIQLNTPCLFPEKDHEIICSVPGVVETGFFINIAKRVIVGYQSGNIEIF